MHVSGWIFCFDHSEIRWIPFVEVSLPHYTTALHHCCPAYCLILQFNLLSVCLQTHVSSWIYVSDHSDDWLAFWGLTLFPVPGCQVWLTGPTETEQLEYSIFGWYIVVSVADGGRIFNHRQRTLLTVYLTMYSVSLLIACLSWRQ